MTNAGCTCVGFGLTRVHDAHCPAMTSAPVNISDAEVERLCLNFSGNNYHNEKYCGECGQSASLDENVIAVLRALRSQLTAAESRIQELEPAAECWAALAACARIKMLGSAGLHPDSRGFSEPDGHIGLEFWTHHDAKGDEQDIQGRVWFSRFMDKAIAAFRAAGRKP